MKRILTSLILPCLLCAGASAQDPALQDPFAPVPYDRESLHKQAPVVPVFMVFAGDTVRFDRPDFRERMDRELISYTYMHTNTTLILKRSRRYFEQVIPILRRYGIPEDLVYLMSIESNLDPKALSSAGAAGLWQFTKATATQYGLEVGTEVDERYNIEKETVAACKFLKDAYAKFGNWMTVAASYNAGQAGIRKRLDDQRQTSALELWLPEETARYMFRLLAMKMFFEHPAAFGFDVPMEERYPYVAPRRTVSVSTGIESLVDFAESHHTTYARLKAANLWLRSDKLTNKNKKTYEILIP